jgi:hypothetical protein
MAYASQSGRARTSAKKPQAFAVCDRCGIWDNWVNLRWQMGWRGPTIQNLRILVCRTCYDTPQEQLRSIVLPADPDPIINARTEYFKDSESDYRAASYPTVIDPDTGIPRPSQVLRTTQDCQNRTLLPFGRPVGLEQDAVMPLSGQMHYGVPLQLLSVVGNGSATVTVTCSAVHNLRQQDNPQVSIEGLAYGPSNGFYSVTVTTATAFTYTTYGSNPAQSLLTPTTNIITALVGLPLGYIDIPKIYGPPLQPQQVGDFLFELEDGSGDILLENGSSFLELEAGP